MLTIEQLAEMSKAVGFLPTDFDSLGAIYNRVSVEHDIPLDVAKAMLCQTSALSPFIKTFAGDKVKETMLYGALLGPFVMLAGSLNSTPERMSSAVRMTVELFIEESVKVLAALAKRRQQTT